MNYFYTYTWLKYINQLHILFVYIYIYIYIYIYEKLGKNNDLKIIK